MITNKKAFKRLIPFLTKEDQRKIGQNLSMSELGDVLLNGHMAMETEIEQVESQIKELRAYVVDVDADLYEVEFLINFYKTIVKSCKGLGFISEKIHTWLDEFVATRMEDSEEEPDVFTKAAEKHLKGEFLSDTNECEEEEACPSDVDSCENCEFREQCEEDIKDDEYDLEEDEGDCECDCERDCCYLECYSGECKECSDSSEEVDMFSDDLVVEAAMEASAMWMHGIVADEHYFHVVGFIIKLADRVDTSFNMDEAEDILINCSRIANQHDNIWYVKEEA